MTATATCAPGRCRRPRLLLDLAAGLLFVLLAAGLLAWRNLVPPASGQGLLRRIYDNPDRRGAPLSTAVDPWPGAGLATTSAAHLAARRSDPSLGRPVLSVEWEGTLLLPRGGYYILALESSATAELFLDGNRWLAGSAALGSALVDEKRLLHPGPHAIRIRYSRDPRVRPARDRAQGQSQGQGQGQIEGSAGAAPEPLRFLWLPPGRRGELEYVPPGVLRPLLPAQAGPLGRLGAASPRDAAFAFALLALLAALAAFLARRRLGAWLEELRQSREARLCLLACGSVFALALAVRLIGLSAAGQTWDEDEYFSSGRNYLQNLLSLDFHGASWRFNYEHPPLSKYIAGLGALLWDGYGPARALFACLGALACGLTFLAGRHLFGLRAGLFAGLALALWPTAIAHGRIVGHETPSLFFVTLAAYVFIRALPSPGFGRRFLLAGVCLGLALCVRFPNALLLVFFAALFLVHVRRQVWRSGALPLPIGLLLLPLCAAAVVFCLWPRLWSAPVGGLSLALAKLRSLHDPEYFLGVLRSPPWHYFPAYFAATTPVGLLGLLGVGVAALSGRRLLPAMAVLLWFATPFCMAFSPVVQDGMRYLLTCLAPAAILAGLGLDVVCAWLGRLSSARPPSGRLVLAWPCVRPGFLGALALLVYLGVTCARIYPYYLDYYNEAVGGPANVARRRWFEVGGWGEGVQEAVDYVNRHAPAASRVAVRVWPNHIIWLSDQLVRSESLEGADFVLWNNLQVTPLDAPGFRELYTVSAQGAPLVKVLGRERK